MGRACAAEAAASQLARSFDRPRRQRKRRRNLIEIHLSAAVDAAAARARPPADATAAADSANKKKARVGRVPISLSLPSSRPSCPKETRLTHSLLPFCAATQSFGWREAGDLL